MRRVEGITGLALGLTVLIIAMSAGVAATAGRGGSDSEPVAAKAQKRAADRSSAGAVKGATRAVETRSSSSRVTTRRRSRGRTVAAPARPRRQAAAPEARAASRPAAPASRPAATASRTRKTRPARRRGRDERTVIASVGRTRDKVKGAGEAVRTAAGTNAAAGRPAVAPVASLGSGVTQRTTPQASVPAPTTAAPQTTTQTQSASADGCERRVRDDGEVRVRCEEPDQDASRSATTSSTSTSEPSVVDGLLP